MRYMIKTSILSAINKDVLRKVCVGRCLMPTKARTNPDIMRRAPATPSAGVMTGLIGSWFESESEPLGIVPFDVLLVAVDVGIGTAVMAEVTSPSPDICVVVGTLSVSRVLVGDMVGVDVSTLWSGVVVLATPSVVVGTLSCRACSAGLLPSCSAHDSAQSRLIATCGRRIFVFVKDFLQARRVKPSLNCLSIHLPGPMATYNSSHASSASKKITSERWIGSPVV